MFGALYNGVSGCGWISMRFEGLRDYNGLWGIVGHLGEYGFVWFEGQGIIGDCEASRKIWVCRLLILILGL